MPLDDVEPQTALLFAQALFKSANVYRRMAAEESLHLARCYHQRALDIRKKLLDSNAVEIADSCGALGATYNELKGNENNTQAIKYYHQALTIYENNNYAKLSVASTLNKLGNAYRDLDEKNIPLAIDYLNRAIKICDSVPNDYDCKGEKAKILYNQGVNYHRLSGQLNFAGAISYLHDAKILFEQLGDAMRLAITLSYLGNVYRCLGDNQSIELAIDSLQQALQIQKKLLGDEHAEIALTLYYLGMTYSDAGGNENVHKAIEFLNAALKIQKKLLREDHQQLVATLQQLKYLSNKQ